MHLRAAVIVASLGLITAACSTPGPVSATATPTTIIVITPPDGIVVRAGNVWITEEAGDMVDEISTTDFIVRIALPPGSGPEQVAVGPANTLWVSEFSSSQVARLTLSS